MVENLVAHATAMLDRVVETFPTYTLRTAKHAENVVQRMEDLLGEDVSQVSALEAALLILSAYYHDIGMVFEPDERGELVKEQPHWDEFLDTFPDAYVAVQENDEVPIDVAEWYCRWRHADRVFEHLNQMSAEDWQWGVVDIREEFGELCKSHNDETASLQSFENDYLAEADLQFCAILLRPHLPHPGRRGAEGGLRRLETVNIASHRYYSSRIVTQINLHALSSSIIGSTLFRDGYFASHHN